MTNRGFRLPGLGHKLSILTLGFTVGLAMGLLWASPTRSWNSVYPPTLTVIRRGLTHLQNQLSAIKNNCALAKAFKSPLVMAKLQAELCDQKPQYAAVIFCVVDMLRDRRMAGDVDLQVNSTWGRHCNHLLFVTNRRYRVRIEHTLFVNNSGSASVRRTLFRYLQQPNVSRDAQWFLWSPVMSFVIVENLRYLVHNLNASKPTYLGPLRSGAPITRPSRVPHTFAFNRAALESIVKANCSGSVTMARCLRRAGVKVLDSRDDQGCARFLDTELTVDKLPFRHALSPNVSEKCVSTTFVSVQTRGWLNGTLYEYLTHVLTPYGLRGRLNVTDAHVPWNASAMPVWYPSDETKPSTTTTTTTATMSSRASGNSSGPFTNT